LKLLVPALRSGTLARGAGDLQPDAGSVIELLLGPPPSIPDDPSRGRVRTALVFPFLMASAMFNLVAFLANLLFLSPALALLTRRRFHLADATAVQLTRDPDSLAKGLNATVNHTAAADWPLARFRSVFIVAPTGSTASDPLGQSFGTHPSTATRHARVVRLGATATAHPTTNGPSGPRGWLVTGLMGLVAVLMVALAPLMLYLMMAVTLLALVVGMMFVMVVLAPLRWLLN
jgi:hypothetical protein